MKKTILSIALCILALDVFAQEEQKSAKDRLSEIENMEVKAKKAKSIKTDNELFEFNALAHAGYGWMSVSGQNFNSKFGPSREIFLNTVNLQFNPAKWLSLEAGLDLKWDKYSVSGEMFTLNNDDIEYLAPTPPVNHIKSSINGFALTVPTMLSLHTPYFSLGGGVEFIFNRNKFTHLNSSYDYDTTQHRTRTNGGKLEPFRLAYRAVLDFDGLGIYYKYCPDTIVWGSDIIKYYHTLGIILTM